MWVGQPPAAQPTLHTKEASHLRWRGDLNSYPQGIPTGRCSCASDSSLTCSQVQYRRSSYTLPGGNRDGFRHLHLPNGTCFLAKNKLHSMVGTMELVPGSILKSGVLWKQQSLLPKAKIGISQNTMYFVVFICPLATPEFLSSSSNFEDD